MIPFFLILLSILDVALLAAMYIFYRKNIAYEDLLSDITEERTLLGKMVAELKSEISSFDKKRRSTTEEMTKIAAEVEQEVSQSEKTIAKSVDSIINEVAQKFEPIMSEINGQKNTLELWHRKVEREKILLQKLLSRLETLFKFFDEKLPYEEILRDIEHKKYHDARYLLTQGYAPERVSQELGMSKAEVELIRDMS